jgi:hypothetical protein
MPFHVDPSWYERTWFTERAPSRTATLSRRARAAALDLARHLAALAF